MKIYLIDTKFVVDVVQAMAKKQMLQPLQNFHERQSKQQKRKKANMKMMVPLIKN
uniref:Uncharacterized protein n=1 Tax=Meloidogyne enterolobii TaxID=390850 RepID=A0A6V7VLW1_MELEN|nr:unnamed protein product [Meloidogyne enterolobii]